MTDEIESKVEQAYAAVVKPGGVVVVPTDTTYGVICRLDDDAAIDRIYEIKGRDRSKPLIILSSDIASALQWIEADDTTVHKLAARFWPGPLTIVAKAKAGVPRSILSGGDTVGIRIPAHSATCRLISLLPNRSIASTSANPSGAGIPKDLAEVTKLMSALVDFILPDCGEPPAGTESTIINLVVDPPTVLRSGAVSNDEISQALR
jgi:L-threonylcarbamoyladenylate synthase